MYFWGHCSGGSKWHISDFKIHFWGFEVSGLSRGDCRDSQICAANQHIEDHPHPHLKRVTLYKSRCSYAIKVLVRMPWKSVKVPLFCRRAGDSYAIRPLLCHIFGAYCLLMWGVGFVEICQLRSGVMPAILSRKPSRGDVSAHYTVTISAGDCSSDSSVKSPAYHYFILVLVTSEDFWDSLDFPAVAVFSVNLLAGQNTAINKAILSKICGIS